jgi:hypothetical protein
MKPGWMFLDVGSYRNEILFDEFAALLIFVGLGDSRAQAPQAGAALKSIRPQQTQTKMPGQAERRGLPILIAILFRP